MSDSSRAALPPAPAKVRILETADRLFYDEGIRSVGVDRLIAASSVTKATFYKHYGSKDRLIIDYVALRRARVDEWFRLRENAEPISLLRELKDGIVASLGSDDFRGDAFLNAAAEFPDAAHPVRRAVEQHRENYLDRLEAMLRQIGHPMPGNAADDLLLARDGAVTGGYVGDSIAAAAALERAFERVIRETEAGRKAA